MVAGVVVGVSAVVVEAAGALEAAISARRVSASLTASALRRYTTWILPPAAVGVSSPATKALTRATSAGVSARMMRLLVRGSTPRFTLGGTPGAAGFSVASGITPFNRLAISTALA